MKAILRSGFLALAIMALAIPANAGPFEDGLAAHESKDYATALKLWQPLAEQDDAKAQFNLGNMYENGRGVSQDAAEAVKWYRKAAGQGMAEAQYNLGNMYVKGEGVPLDVVLAYMWFNLAAAQGLENAQHNRDIAANTMTPDQIAEAQRMAHDPHVAYCLGKYRSYDPATDTYLAYSGRVRRCRSPYSN